ncbi:MAG: ATP-binding protein [Acidobacteria bacterium]|nr:ATP-binding protein [Acidobacteriota bacterium]
MEKTANIVDAVGRVRDPELDATLAELGMIQGVHVDGETVVVKIALTTRGCPLRGRIEADALAAARQAGASDVRVEIAVLGDDERAELMRRARALAQSRAPETSVPRTAPVIMVASGKGGVGKSSVTANLAEAFARRGLSVGVLDADIWGFSLTRLLGIRGPIDVRNSKMVPVRSDRAEGSLHLLSMGHLADERRALMWRGLMVQKAVAQFLQDADWSGVDILLVDTPPGTGDIPMTLSRLLPHLGALLVTTPNAAAQGVAARSGDFAEKSNLRLLGVVENMSAYRCECGAEHSPFGFGGGERLAEELGTSLLARIPLDAAISSANDDGRPLARAPHQDFDQLAATLWPLAQNLVPQGCSARLLDALDRAVGV